LGRFIRTTIIMTLIALIGELFFAPVLSLGPIAPDFTIIALVILALAEGSFAACLAGFCIGIIQDIPTPELLGLQALVKCLLGFQLGRVRDRLVYGMPLVEGSLVALAALAHDGIVLLARGAVVGGDVVGPFFLSALPSAVYSGLLGVLLIRLADRLGVISVED